MPFRSLVLAGPLALTTTLAAFAQPAARAIKDVRPLIVCLGDSLTAGNGDGSYPNYLQHDLDRDGFHYRVENMGMPASTTADWLPRLESVTSLRPAFVILELGGSDGLAGKVPVATIEANLGKLITGIEASGAKVVLAGIRMPDGFDPIYARQFSGVYTTVAERYKLPLFPFLYEGVYNVPGMMEADGIHAKPEGNAVVARKIAAFLEPLLPERPGSARSQDVDHVTAGEPMTGEQANGTPAESSGAAPSQVRGRGACPVEIRMDARGQLSENRMHGIYPVSRQTLASDLLGGCKESPVTSVSIDFAPQVRTGDAVAFLDWVRQQAPAGVGVAIVAPQSR